MQINVLFGLSTVLLLVGCGTTNQLTPAGAQVRLIDTGLNSQCVLLGQVSGVQRNWLSDKGYVGSSMLGAINDLRNKAASMGGNIIYGASPPSATIWSNLAPLDSKITGQVYKCP